MRRAKGHGKESLTGRVVGNGRYQVSRLIGRGSFGIVYEAVHVATGRALALKVLSADRDRREELARRFEREAKAASLLDHPNIVEVLDLGTLEDGALFMVMELVSGTSVADLVEAGPVGVRRALVIANQVLAGLGHAHEHDIVHRDLKPENVMLVRTGDPGLEYEIAKILDFGLVKVLGETAAELGGGRLTQLGVVFGSPAYMAPEQALGRPIDGRADLYALGIVLFEMLTGRRPFESDDPLTVMRAHVSSPAPTLRSVVGAQPWCTPEMEHVVAGALEKKPDQRFGVAPAMAAAIEAAFASINYLPPGV